MKQHKQGHCSTSGAGRQRNCVLHPCFQTHSISVGGGQVASPSPNMLVVNRCSSVSCCPERQKALFERVMWWKLGPGQGAGCEIVGIPGSCRLDPPNPLHSLLRPSSPRELCVKGGLLQSWPPPPPPLSKSSLLSLTFTFPFSPVPLRIFGPSCVSSVTLPGLFLPCSPRWGLSPDKWP